MGANEWNKCRVLIKIRTFLFPSSIIAPCMLNTHTHTCTYPGLSHTTTTHTQTTTHHNRATTPGLSHTTTTHTPTPPHTHPHTHTTTTHTLTHTHTHTQTHS